MCVCVDFYAREPDFRKCRSEFNVSITFVAMHFDTEIGINIFVDHLVHILCTHNSLTIKSMLLELHLNVQCPIATIKITFYDYY